MSFVQRGHDLIKERSGKASGPGAKGEVKEQEKEKVEKEEEGTEKVSVGEKRKSPPGKEDDEAAETQGDADQEEGATLAAEEDLEPPRKRVKVDEDKEEDKEENKEEDNEEDKGEDKEKNKDDKEGGRKKVTASKKLKKEAASPAEDSIGRRTRSHG